MVLTVGAARHPLDGLPTRRRRRRRHALGAVAVGAHGEAALAARPVHVEQRRVASVTHLANALNRPLPDHLRRCPPRTHTHTHTYIHKPQNTKGRLHQWSFPVPQGGLQRQQSRSSFVFPVQPRSRDHLLPVICGPFWRWAVLV